MAFPDIFPIQPGRDGWSPTFSTSASRILHHCGLDQLTKKGPGGRLLWEVNADKRVPDWVATQETRPLKIGFTAISNIIRRVLVVHGKGVALDIMKVHGNVETLVALRPRHYAAVYVACQAALNTPPDPNWTWASRRLPPPQKRPHA